MLDAATARRNGESKARQTGQDAHRVAMSLTTRILLLVILALTPALAIQGYNEHALRASRDEAVRADALVTARALAGSLQQLTDSVRQALDLLAEDPAVRARDPVACTDYLTRSVARLPHVITLSLSRADGPVICNSLGSPPGSYSNAARDYQQRALAREGFAVGGFIRGVKTGKASIHFAEPLRDRDGAIVGILNAGVDLTWLAGFLQNDLRLPSSAATLTDGNGVILMRYPNGIDWIGRPLPAESPSNAIPGAEGVIVDRAFDGHERIIAQILPDGDLQGMRIIVGRDRDLAFADVDQATRRGLILIAVGAGLAIAAALVAGRLFIRRPIERLLRAARAWQGGNLTARTGLTGVDEFGQLGSTLDATASVLERTDASLRNEIAYSRSMHEQQTTMLHELNHRVKNTLATVQSLARQSRGSEAQAVQLEARILALSKTHDLLTREDWTGAPLREVLENELHPYRNGADHIVLDGPDVALVPRYVLAIGMTVHELTTNAAKYGALSTTEGRIRVKWSLMPAENGERRLRLDWQETGGPRVEPPTRRGFGTRLISGGIQRELAGSVQLDFEPAGLHCIIEVPLQNLQSSMLSPVSIGRTH